MAADPTTIGNGPMGNLSRYDLHLLGIPLVLLIPLLGHLLFGVALQPSLVAASLLCACLIADAIFLNPPRSRRDAV